MIKSSDIPLISKDDAIELVRERPTHPHYSLANDRARIMRAWYNAQARTVGSDTLEKQSIVRKSPIESQAEYDDRVKNFDLIPLEHKFLHTQQRIYDENNVQRTYPNDFWSDREKHFDDQGSEIDVFWRDKVLYVKEVEGFGGIALDIAMKDGDPISVDGKAVPYPYIVQSHELINFETWFGLLKFVVTETKKGDKSEYRVFTPKEIYVFEDQQAAPKRIKHNFGQTPFILLKGAPDPSSGFKIGMPRRFNLSGMYLMLSELNYDLKLGSQYFGHPIQALPESYIRQISGAYDEEEKKYDAQIVKDEVGQVLVYQDGEAPPQLFYQADMQGLQHLRQVIFEDYLNTIYQIAQVRDKSKVVHNASGRSKQFDSVEEQGLLAQTAMDMEVLENQLMVMMGNARGEKGFNVIYSKHHDLSSANEIWSEYTEGNQYGGVPFEVRKYQVTEYLRKKSAPKETREALLKELENKGFPVEGQPAALTNGVQHE